MGQDGCTDDPLRSPFQPIDALATYLLGQPEAEDIVQDVYLRRWHKADQFDPKRGQFSTWFLAVARHRTLDELRRRGDQHRIQTADEVDRVLTEAIDPAEDPTREARQHERGEIVRRALQILPKEQRRAIALAYFGGLSQSA